MSMNNYFGDWYRSAGVPPEGIPLEKRWEAIDSFGVGGKNVILLTQIFYQLNLTDASFPKEFRAAFNKVDPNFQMSGNDRELIVLAGAELVDVMKRSAREIADFAALCLVCAGAQSLRAAPAVQQIPEIAAHYLSERSVARATSEEENDEKTEETEIKKLLLEFPIVSEESNMLWWLISETSRDMNQRWSEMPVSMACTLAAKELADLTRIIPGPIAARAFLDRVVRSGRDKTETSGRSKKVAASISITDMVNDTAKT